MSLQDIAAAKITEYQFNNEKAYIIKRMNRNTMYAIDNQLSLKISVLDRDYLRVVWFLDFYFANNYDLSTQLGHICFLSDMDDEFSPIYFKSY